LFGIFRLVGPRDSSITGPTYIWTAEGEPYVAAVVDLFSRRVVGWSMRVAMTAQLVTEALVMAI
jgi:putative transposase